MTRNAYIQACALLVVAALSLSGLSLAAGGTEGATSTLQDRTMSINGVAVDGDDNIIVTGEVYDSNAEKWIIRTEKYGSDGHLIWRKEFKQYEQNIGKDVAVDASGNIIVAGAIGSAGDILPNMDYFLLKYSSNGNQVLWKNTYNNGLSDVPWRVTVDGQTGNIFVTGVTIRLVGTDSATSNIWTIKASGSNGALMEEHVLDIDDSADMGVGIALTSDREVIVAGSTKLDAPYYDAYCVQRYTNDLEPTGSPFFYQGENANDSASGLAIDSSDNLFVTGHTSGMDGQDFFTIKYNKNNQERATDLRDYGEAKNSALAIAVDNVDNVIIAGSTVSGGNRFCTIKYNNNLGKQWIRQETFTGEAKAVAVDSDNNIIVAGYNTNRDNQYYTIKYSPSGTVIWQGGGGAAPQQPPEASFTGPGSAFVGQPVQFTDTSTGTVTSRSWDFGDGGTGSGAAATHTYTSSGTYTVTLTVSGAGETDTATKQITVSNAPPKPSFSYAPLAPTVGASISFDASASYDPYGGSISSYSWDFGDGSSGSGRTTSHSYDENGTFQITLTVTDADGASATFSKMVTVNPVGSHAPTALFDYEPMHPDVGETVTFDASDSTDDGTILLYRWDWESDGTYNDERAATTATHSWPEEGTYTVTLEVEDNNGTINTYTDTVTVGGGEPSLLLSAPASANLSNGRATVIVTVRCFNQTVEDVSIEVDDDAGGTVTVTPIQATIQAGAQHHFELDIDVPSNASGSVLRVHALGGDGTQSQTVDIQLNGGGDSNDSPGFAAILALAAIFIVLLALRRLKR